MLSAASAPEITLLFFDPGTLFEWKTSNYCVLILFIAIIIANVVGTISYRIKKSRNKEFKDSDISLIDFFSLERNTNKIFSMKPDMLDKSSNLNAFSGIRVIMMYYVIIGHTFFILTSYYVIKNPLMIPVLQKGWIFAWLL